MKAIAQLTTAEMVAEYNTLTGKSIKKFSSRAAGERQLAAARANDPKQLPTATEEELNHLFNQETTVEQLAKVRAEASTTEHTQDGKICKAPPKSMLRSKAISNSWNDAEIAAKRSRRDHVMVNGVVHHSVRAAFVALKLPMSQHIKFRMAVKQDGSGVFETGDKKYHFQLVEAK